MKNNKKIFKIVIIAIIALGVIGAWAAKNIEKNNVNIPKEEGNINVEDNNQVIIDQENESIAQPIPEASTPEQKQPIEQPIKEEEPIQEEQPQEPQKPVIDKNDPNFTLVVESLDLETLKSYKLPMMIDFGSDGCAPCREMAPVLVDLNTELRGKVIVKFVDVWEHPSASEGFDFSLIPTQFFFDKYGNRYTSHTGGLTKDEAMEILKELGVE